MSRGEREIMDVLFQLGGEGAAEEIRLEGKGYVVKDGDILNIRHG